MKKITTLFTLALFGFLLTACSGGNQNGAGAAAEKYFRAIAAGDENQIVSVSCPDWESGAKADVAAFIGVKARLENVTCAPVSGSAAESDSVVVECAGAIVATYNNEDSNFELKGKQLTVTKQGGEWLVCGYSQ